MREREGHLGGRAASRRLGHGPVRGRDSVPAARARPAARPPAPAPSRARGRPPPSARAPARRPGHRGRRPPGGKQPGRPRRPLRPARPGRSPAPPRPARGPGARSLARPSPDRALGGSGGGGRGRGGVRTMAAPVGLGLGALAPGRCRVLAGTTTTRAGSPELLGTTGRPYQLEVLAPSTRAGGAPPGRRRARAQPPASTGRRLRGAPWVGYVRGSS